MSQTSRDEETYDHETCCYFLQDFSYNLQFHGPSYLRSLGTKLIFNDGIQVLEINRFFTECVSYFIQISKEDLYFFDWSVLMEESNV